MPRAALQTHFCFRHCIGVYASADTQNHCPRAGMRAQPSPLEHSSSIRPRSGCWWFTHASRIWCKVLFKTICISKFIFFSFFFNPVTELCSQCPWKRNKAIADWRYDKVEELRGHDSVQGAARACPTQQLQCQLSFHSSGSLLCSLILFKIKVDKVTEDAPVPQSHRREEQDYIINLLINLSVPVLKHS